MESDNFKSLKEFLEYIATGRKFTRNRWQFDQFAYLDNNLFVNQDDDHQKIFLEDYYTYLPYNEPKKKKQITLYRYTHKTSNEIYQSSWVSEERTLTENIILVETKLIEVDNHV